MRDIPRFAATLTLVALIAAGSLAWINDITKPKILAQEKQAFNDALVYVLAEAKQGKIDSYMKDNRILYYQGYTDKTGEGLIGYAFQAEGEGYSSTIKTMVGVDTSFRILAIKILSQQETPGLGTRCEEIRSGDKTPWWQAQFNGKNATELVVDKNGGTIESITGATITSQAITNSIAGEAKTIRNEIMSITP